MSAPSGRTLRGGRGLVEGVDLRLHLEHAYLGRLDVAELPGGVGPEEEAEVARRDDEVGEHRDEERGHLVASAGVPAQRDVDELVELEGEGAAGGEHERDAEHP